MGKKELEAIRSKLIEELSELTVELIKQHNRPHKDLMKKISEEYGDVVYWMEKYRKHHALENKLITKKIKEKKIKYGKV